jgi:hypothetical protein
MIGTLYRYPHPKDATKFIYVGQGFNRDKDHRSGIQGFGKRFRKRFPNEILPEPIKEQIEVFSQLELNEEETIWMFRFHTWRGYPDGMNLTFPGSVDYKNVGKIGGQIAVDTGQIQELAKSGIGGRIGIRKQSREAKVAAGRLGGFAQPREAKVKGGRRSFELYGSWGTTEGRRKAGLKVNKLYPNLAVENGRKARKMNPESTILAGKKGGRKNVETGWIQRLARITNCLRWNIRRGKPCVCGEHGEANVS